MPEDEKSIPAVAGETDGDGDSAMALAPANEVAIRDLIYTVRGAQVMLDSDLAMLYGVETKVLN